MKRLFALALAFCACGDDAQPPFTANCTAGTPSAEAKLPAGPYAGHAGSQILLDGRVLAPAGRQVPVGGFPLGMKFVGGGTRLLAITDGAKDTESIRIVDWQAGQVLASEPYSGQHGLFYGLAVSPSGMRIYASGGGENVVHVLDVNGSTGALAAQPDLAIGGFPAGLAISSDGNTLYVAQQVDGKIAQFDLQQNRITRLIDVGGTVKPLDVVLAPTRNEAYVTLWDAAAVGIVDLASGNVTRIMVGKNPEGVVVLPDGNHAVTAVSDEDTLVVLDLLQQKVAQTVPMGLDAMYVGSSPNGIALSPDGSRLWVTLGAENSLVGVSTADFMPIGRLPTGWYPGAVTVAPDGTVIVANSKGADIGPSTGTMSKESQLAGTLTVLSPEPDDATLQAGTQTVAANQARPAMLPPAPQCPAQSPRFPLPINAGDATPIQHVMLVVRENKTYDAELGSLPGANGDPSLEVFGPTMTPNLRALAARFVNMDNFYLQSEESLQGHILTTAAFVNDFTEKTWLQTWGRGWRDMTLYGEPTVGPASGYIWQKLQHDQVSYVDMGEIVGTVSEPTAVNIDNDYPGLFFVLDVADADRGNYVAKQLANPNWKLPRFTYLILPRNHTEGTRPGSETPESMIADNDEATGVIVEALTKSRWWQSTVMFIIEDDPSDGGDHIDGHRSICLVVSPWVRRGYVSSVLYGVPSIFRTIEQLLNLSAMHQTDAQAGLMTDIWGQTADSEPFVHIPRMIPVTTNAADAPYAEESMHMDFSGPDRAHGLGRLLWRYFKHTEPPWLPSPDADDD